MANVQTIALQRIEETQLVVIASTLWDAFCIGGAPLRSRNGKVDLLLVTLRDGVCDEIDPVTLAVDTSGYLVRGELRLRPLPEHPSVFDARLVFLRRYFRHVHWIPSEQLIRDALLVADRAART